MCVCLLRVQVSSVSMCVYNLKLLRKKRRRRIKFVFVTKEFLFFVFFSQTLFFHCNGIFLLQTHQTHAKCVCLVYICHKFFGKSLLGFFFTVRSEKFWCSKCFKTQKKGIYFGKKKSFLVCFSVCFLFSIQIQFRKIPGKKIPRNFNLFGLF